MSLRRMVNLQFRIALTKPMLILLISLRNPSSQIWIESGHRSARGPVRIPKELQLRKMTGELHLAWVSGRSKRHICSCWEILHRHRASCQVQSHVTPRAAWRHHVEYVACENCLDDGIHRKKQHVLSLSGPCGCFHKAVCDNAQSTCCPVLLVQPEPRLPEKRKPKNDQA